jgi:hypothetical protein
MSKPYVPGLGERKIPHMRFNKFNTTFLEQLLPFVISDCRLSLHLLKKAQEKKRYE